MTLSKFILLGLLLLPAAEIAGFLVAAALIGVWAALGALLAVSLLGAVVLRRAAGRQIAEFRRQVAGDPVKALDINASGLRGLGAGVLLLVPGFITGGLGFLLLLVPLRWYGGLFGRTLGPGSADEAGHSLVDLERNEWRVEEAPQDPGEEAKRRLLDRP
jgi:UPF0716 protein FxsA